MLFVFRFVAVIVLNSLQMSVVIGAFPLKKISFPYSRIFRSLSFEPKFWNNLPQLLSILSKWYLSSCQSLLAFCNLPCLCCKAKRIVFQLKVTLEFYEVTRVQSSCPKTNNSDHSKNSQSTVPYLPAYNTHFFPIKITIKSRCILYTDSIV